MSRYRIVYPSGDTTQLTIALIEYWTDDLDYSLASHRVFEDRDEAISYAWELAKQFNRAYVGPRNENTHFYLD